MFGGAQKVRLAFSHHGLLYVSEAQDCNYKIQSFYFRVLNSQYSTQIGKEIIPSSGAHQTFQLTSVLCAWCNCNLEVQEVESYLLLFRIQNCCFVLLSLCFTQLTLHHPDMNGVLLCIFTLFCKCVMPSNIYECTFTLISSSALRHFLYTEYTLDKKG